MNFDFNNIDPAEEGKGFTAPGTIAVFTIEEVKFNEKDGKEIFEVTFSRKEDSFREYFYLTEKAAPRFVYLYEKVMGTKNLPEAEQGIISALTGKNIALKVIGSVNQNTGKGYPCLPFSGFARPVGELGDLSFSNSEKGKIDAAIQAQQQSAAAPTRAETDQASKEVKEVFGTDDNF